MPVAGLTRETVTSSKRRIAGSIAVFDASAEAVCDGQSGANTVDNR